MGKILRKFIKMYIRNIETPELDTLSYLDLDVMLKNRGYSFRITQVKEMYNDCVEKAEKDMCDA